MSTRQDEAPSAAITSRDDLVAWIAAGEKPPADWRIGTEHEKFVFRHEDLGPVPYEGENGINALMHGLMDCCGWVPITENDNIIALKRAPGEPGGTVSLEPGGQFELSGAPLISVHETCAETSDHLRQCHRAGDELGLGFSGLGFAPVWALKDIPTMPKARYGVMTGYMPKVGTRGLDMMYRTATIQVNLDFGTEADMVQKLRVSLALQPIATALFASSPFTDGKPNGFKSARSNVWLHTDPNRTGMLPWAFEDGMGYEAYVDYALKVPMYFVYRKGRYIDVSGACFGDFLAGRLPGLENEVPTLDDWSDHLTTLFPEVRLKRFLEMRGADGGSRDMICALAAFWTGLLYDRGALNGAWDIVKGWSEEQRHQLREDVPVHALEARIAGRDLVDVARDVIAVSREGLRRRAMTDTDARNEAKYLEPLDEIAESGQTAADRLLAAYHGAWGGDISAVYEATAL